MPATPKHEIRTRKQDKARQGRLDAKAREACLDAVWNRSGDAVEIGLSGRCEACRKTVWRYSGSPMMQGHVHEIKPRSLGGDPTDPNGCQLLCPVCHGKAHGLRFGKDVV